MVCGSLFNLSNSNYPHGLSSSPSSQTAKQLLETLFNVAKIILLVQLRNLLKQNIQKSESIDAWLIIKEKAHNNSPKEESMCGELCLCLLKNLFLIIIANVKKVI